MDDDDEKRFPRITLWQFLKSAVLAPLTFLELLFGYGLMADLTPWRKPRKKEADAGPSERAWPQASDKIE